MAGSVLVYPRFPKRLIDRLAARYELMDAGSRTPAEAFTGEQRAKIAVLVTAGGRQTTRQFMDDLPNLKLIACAGTGYDGVDRKAAKEKGIIVGHSPGANASAVADQAVTLMLAVMRNVVRADAFVRSGGWASGQRANIPAAPGLEGRKVGIYGMGEIGQRIAARVAAFDADVQYFSRRKLDDLPYRYHPTLESLVGWCEVLQIAVRAGADNRHIIDAGMLRRLGPGGYLINISRGSVIDEAALFDALKSGAIAGAGLDVYQNEPNINPAFVTLPNTVLSPHLGGHTVEAHESMQNCLLENLAAFFAGKPLPYPVPLD